MAKRVATTTREAVGYIARAVEARLVAVAPVLVVSLVLVMVVSWIVVVQKYIADHDFIRVSKVENVTLKVMFK